MARRPTQSVPIELDKSRTLRFSAGSIASLEEKYDAPITELLQKFADPKNVRVRFIVDLLHNGLIHEDESLTAQAVGNMIDMSDLPVVLPLILQAVKESFPAPKANDPNAPAPA